MRIISVAFFNARLTGFEISEKKYDYPSKDNTIEVDDVVLAGAYQSPAIVVDIKSTNDEDVVTTHKNRKTGKELPLIQTSGMNVDIYAKTLTSKI